MGDLPQWALLFVPAVKETSMLLPQWTMSKWGFFLFFLVKAIDDAKMFSYIYS